VVISWVKPGSSPVRVVNALPASMSPLPVNEGPDVVRSMRTSWPLDAVRRFQLIRTKTPPSGAWPALRLGRLLVAPSTVGPDSLDTLKKRFSR
jgi:hypothetical protein